LGYGRQRKKYILGGGCGDETTGGRQGLSSRTEKSNLKVWEKWYVAVYKFFKLH
jgi:hypothetical protein